MKKLLSISAILLFLFSCNPPIRTIVIYSTDEHGRTIKKIDKYYDTTSTYGNTMIAYGVYPYWYGYPNYPYVRPYVVQRPIVVVRPQSYSVGGNHSYRRH